MSMATSLIGYAQSVTPLTTTTTVIPTTAASPVVTAATATTTTTTNSTQTLMDAFYAQLAAQQQAVANQAAAEAKAQATSAQIAAGMQLAFKYCPFLQESNAQKARKRISDVEKKIAEQADAPNSKDPSIKEQNKQSIGQDIQNASLPEACDIFIKSQNGEPGSVGTTLLAGIREEKSSFADKLPEDIQFYCPNYKSMDPEKKNLFWLWAMMSISATESGCESKAVNPKAVNGKAIGLFQLGKDQCPNSNLKDDVENAACALKKFSGEMSNRSTLFATSGGSVQGATTWAAICKGDQKACGKNPGAADKTIATIRKFSACGASPDGGAVSEPQQSADSADSSPKEKRAPSGKKQKKSRKPIQPQIT